MKKLLGTFLLCLLTVNSCKEKDSPVESQTPTLPSVTTFTISEFTSVSAKGGGSVTSDGGATVTAKGLCWNTTSLPLITDNNTVDGTGMGSFTSNITNLSPNVKYYVRAYATNSAETGYGNEVSFTTTNTLPILTTQEMSQLTQHTATSGGIISSEGSNPIILKGVCWSLNPTPTILDKKTNNGSGLSNFISLLDGLSSNTKYYVRAFATSSVGTGYGNQVSFTTREDTIGTVTDIDGNVYKTVKIGSQWWMAENLRTTKYRNGDLIPNVTDETAWSILTTGAYCNYEKSDNNALIYGRLYNWYAVNDSRNIAPTGWHVANDAEWSTLTTYVGSASNAGTKLKSKTGWNNNGNGTDDYGFMAFPGGARGNSGGFYYIGYNGYWWSSTEYNPIDEAVYRSMFYNISDVYGGLFVKRYGFSVRCIRD